LGENGKSREELKRTENQVRELQNEVGEKTISFFIHSSSCFYRKMH
jgi:hypothetical protein